MNKDSKIYVAGHRGLAGSAIVRELIKEGYSNIIVKNHSQLDLTRQAEVEDFFKEEKPEYVFLLAAKVGGIMANLKSPAEFYYINSMIDNNVIHSAYLNNVKKLLYFGSSCAYPTQCVQPMKEEFLMSGYLEPTNEAYALAKLSGLKMCNYYKAQHGMNFIGAMATNIYGPFDNFSEETSHVLPALIKKFHKAKTENLPFVEI